jgi:UDP-N-acetylglucosamine diphosphorylase/glucosamine-1-phosphate N-acetyltransferase
MWNQICLFNDQLILQKLRPITDHRNTWNLLLGTSSLLEKWQSRSRHEILTLNGPNLLELPKADIYIMGSCLPKPALLDHLKRLNNNSALIVQNQLIAFKSNKAYFELNSLEIHEIPDAHLYVQELEDSLIHNNYFLCEEIKSNTFEMEKFQKNGNIILHPQNCFIHPSAEVKGSILDASSGPIYIGKNVSLNIGTLVQGPACLLDQSSTNIGAKIRPNCTIGQGCKVGGEINHSIFYPFSNKSHEGYIGSSIIGSFSNLGAMTTCSNVKNDLKQVSIYDFSQNNLRKTPEKNLGIIMGDYVTTGIGTVFNTGTWIGSHCNISSVGFPPKHIPSFTWGEFPNVKTYQLEKAFDVAQSWTKLKGQNIHQNLEQRMKEIWKENATFRT